MRNIKQIIKEEVQNYFNDNFWKWFGNSKVVNKDGKPLVVYHGTSGDFDVFKKLGSQTGHPSAELGYYFTTNRTVADRFTKDVTNIKPFGNVAYEPHRTGANIMFVYLSIQNPKTLTAREFMNLMVKDDYSGIRMPEDYAKIKEDLIAQGYDGVIISPTEWSPGLEEYEHTQFIAFYPEQIKSATGNSGEFSPTNSDIVKEEIYNIGEGYKEVDEISMLADDIINYFSKHNSSMLTNIKKDGKITPENLQFGVNNIPLSTIADNLNKYGKEIQDFIVSGKVNIRFGLSRYTAGGYDKIIGVIFLNLLKRTFIHSMQYYGIINLQPNLSFVDRPIKNPEELLKKMLTETLKDTIIHELQHAYDAYRSKGRYDKDKASKEYYAALTQDKGIKSIVDNKGKFINLERYNQYLNLPHEYWARFSQTLNGMDMNRNFNNVLNDFKWRFRGYDVLPAKGKKRILNSLYKYHQLKNTTPNA